MQRRSGLPAAQLLLRLAGKSTLTSDGFNAFNIAKSATDPTGQAGRSTNRTTSESTRDVRAEQRWLERVIDDLDAAPVKTASGTYMIPPAESLMGRRMRHQVAFDATLKEVFLTHGVQLREPIGSTSKGETIVYGGMYRDAEVAVDTPATTLMFAMPSVNMAHSNESEKTMILSRRHPSIVQVMEYGDADLPDDMPQELREFFPQGWCHSHDYRAGFLRLA